MSHRRSIAVPALVVLVALVALAGCAGLAPGGDRAGPSAEELQDRALERMGEVESYSLDSTTTVLVEDTTLETAVTGVVNRTARRAELNTTTRLNGSLGSSEQVLEIYIDGETMYASRDGRDRWQALDVDRIADYGGTHPWEDDQVRLQRSLLADAEVRANGSETVRGRSTTVVEIEPTDESVDEYLAARSPQGTGLDGADVENVTLTQWVTDEGYVLRTEASMTVIVQGQRADVTVHTALEDFDEPTDIEIPEAALGAEQT